MKPNPSVERTDILNAALLHCGYRSCQTLGRETQGGVMYAWGIALMVIGAASFVLPLFGRQFILVAALGLTGIGSAVAGVIIFAIGVVFFHLARTKERQEDATHLAEMQRIQRDMQTVLALQHTSAPPHPYKQNLSSTNTEALPPITPRQLGQALALSLGTYNSIENLTTEEKELLAQCDLSPGKYLDEVAYLKGVAIDFAISRFLGNTAIGKEVRSGYLGVWEDISKKDLEGYQFFVGFLRRLETYAHAINVEISDHSENDNGLESISQIALAFSGVVDNGNGVTSVLALTVADSYFWSQVEGVEQALRKAELLSFDVPKA